MKNRTDARFPGRETLMRSAAEDGAKRSAYRIFDEDLIGEGNTANFRFGHVRERPPTGIGVA